MCKRWLNVFLSVLICTLPLFAGACASAGKKEHTVSFSTNGVEAAAMPGDVLVADGEAVAEPEAPEADGYDFKGWYYEPECKNAFYFDYDKITGDIMLYAKWSEKPSDAKLSEISGEQLKDAGLVKWTGRNEYKAETGSVNFYYTASGFEIRFFGTKLSAVLTTDNTSDENEFAKISVAVDGEILPDGRVITLKQASEQIVLAEGLPEGEHTVRAAKRSEPEDSGNSVVRFITDGYFLPAPEASQVKMLCIGASGISGHGSIGVEGQGRTTANSSSLHGFGYLTARMFGADVQFVSSSGWGIKYGFNRSGGAFGQADIPAAFERVGISRSGGLLGEYDVSSFIPDAVIVNAGGNDYSAYINSLSGSASDEAVAAFKRQVGEFCTRLMTLYPKTIIFWTYTSGAKNGLAAISAINALPSGVMSRIVPVVITQVGDFGDPEGANGHASVRTHIRISDILADQIEKVSKMRRITDNITV